MPKPKLTFYKNFEDMEKSKYTYTMNTDVVIRIKNTIELIKRIYGYDDKSPVESKKVLYFKENI